MLTPFSILPHPNENGVETNSGPNLRPRVTERRAFSVQAMRPMKYKCARLRFQGISAAAVANEFGYKAYHSPARVCPFAARELVNVRPTDTGRSREVGLRAGS